MTVMQSWVAGQMFVSGGCGPTSIQRHLLRHAARWASSSSGSSTAAHASVWCGVAACMLGGLAFLHAVMIVRSIRAGLAVGRDDG